MSKYVLAKDSPFAKKGTEVSSYKNQNELQPGLQVYIDIKNIDSDIIDYAPIAFARSEQIFLGAFGYLKENGWIEEVKPREFYVAPFFEDGNKRYKQVDEKIRYIDKFKVREVL